MNDVAVYVVNFILSILSFLFIARFLIQACRVDFYNPLSQTLIKITDPVLKPLRVVLPGFRNLDAASFLATVLIEMVLLYTVSTLAGNYPGTVVQILAVGVLQALLLITRIFWGSILIVIIASFLAPGNRHPALGLLHQITEPLLGPARRLLPPMGGLDFSPILVFLLLGVVERILPQVLMSFF